MVNKCNYQNNVHSTMLSFEAWTLPTTLDSNSRGNLNIMEGFRLTEDTLHLTWKVLGKCHLPLVSSLDAHPASLPPFHPSTNWSLERRNYRCEHNSAKLQISPLEIEKSEDHLGTAVLSPQPGSAAQHYGVPVRTFGVKWPSPSLFLSQHQIFTFLCSFSVNSVFCTLQSWLFC